MKISVRENSIYIFSLPASSGNGLIVNLRVSVFTGSDCR